MTIDHHALLSLVISMLNARNGIHLIKIMQLEKLYRLIQQLQVLVSWLINLPVNSSSPCIDLIFTSNTNSVTDFGVDPALYKTYHHNSIFGKINFNILLPPPFYRNIWNYKNAYVENDSKSKNKL